MRQAVLLGLLFLLVALSVVLPAQAVRKNPVAGCFLVVGMDPQGVVHYASFYHWWQAHKQAQAWKTAGWTDVAIGGC